MKVKIYQLPVEHERCFRGFDTGKRVPVEDYELVWEGELIARTLEKVYRELNYAHPADYKARSLSVSDIVEVVREDGRSDKWFCDSVGWERIEGAMPAAVVGGVR
jgi:hypothetical protein